MFLNIYTEDDELRDLYRRSAEEYNCNSNAGFDLFVPSAVVVPKGQLCKINLQVYVCLTDGENFYRYYLYPRSSMPNKGLMLANSVGLIDSGYRNYPKDVLCIQVFNYTNEVVEVKRISRLVQIDSGLLFKPIVKVLNFGEWMEQCQSKARGGFGSTGG
jgi:dUTPase